jgi:ribose 5-phosphate isomerase B
MVDFTETIAIAGDHAGFELKEFLKGRLAEEGYHFEDFGTFSADPVDYPDQIHPLAKEINDGRFKKGIIICGSGNGVAITANKYQNVRAAICWREDITKLARQHNDANVIALPARFISKEEAVQFVRIFLSAEFEGGRHQRRVDKIAI